METIGRHLIAEFYGCPADKLDDLEHIRSSMLQAVEEIGATLVGETFHRFAPQGVTGVVVIAESHLSIHTWPESGYVALDLYTCGGLDPRPGLESLQRALEAHNGRFQEIVRGLPRDLEPGRTIFPDDVQILSRVVPDVNLLG